MIMDFISSINSATDDLNLLGAPLEFGTLVGETDAKHFFGFKGGSSTDRRYWRDYQHLNLTHFGFSFYIRFPVGAGLTQFRRLVSFGNSNIASFLAFEHYFYAGELRIQAKLGQNMLPIHTVTLTDNVWTRIDVNMDLSLTGHLTIAVDGVEVYSLLNADTTNAGEHDKLAYCYFQQVSVEETNTDEQVHFKSFFLTDGEATEDIIMYQHQNTGNGSHTDMVGSYTDVTKSTIDPETALKATDIDQVSTITIDQIPTEYSGYEVVAVGVAAKTITEVNGLKTAIVFDDGTNVDESQAFEATYTNAPVQYISNLAPDGLAWDISKVNSLEVGVKSK